MRTFTLLLREPTQSHTIESVTSFTAEDESGSFGIMPNHLPMTTLLTFGLARYKTTDRPWRYIAMPGALLTFQSNCLKLTTQRYLLCDDYREIDTLLQETLLQERNALKELTNSVKRIEENVMRKLSKLNTNSNQGGLIR